MPCNESSDDVEMMVEQSVIPDKTGHQIMDAEIFYIWKLPENDRLLLPIGAGIKVSIIIKYQSGVSSTTARGIERMAGCETRKYI